MSYKAFFRRLKTTNTPATPISIRGIFIFLLVAISISNASGEDSGNLSLVKGVEFPESYLLDPLTMSDYRRLPPVFQGIWDDSVNRILIDRMLEIERLQAAPEFSYMSRELFFTAIQLFIPSCEAKKKQGRQQAGRQARRPASKTPGKPV